MDVTWLLIGLTWAAITGPVGGINVTHVTSDIVQSERTDALFNVSYSNNLSEPTIIWLSGNQIARWKSSSVNYNETQVRYRDRLVLYPNGSMLLKNVSVTDSGLYTVQIVDYVSIDGVGTLKLDVYARTGHINVVPPLAHVTRTVGANVTLSVAYLENKVDPQVTWVFTNQIAQWNVNDLTKVSSRDNYAQRLTAFSNGSLALANVQLNDSGSYEVTVVDNNMADGKARVTLDVYESITNATLEIIPARPSLGGGAVLRCTAPGTVNSGGMSFTFYKDDATLDVLNETGSTAANHSVANVTFGYRGSYRCRVANPLSGATSDPVQLTLACDTNGSTAGVLTVADATVAFVLNAELLLSVRYSFPGTASLVWAFNGRAMASWMLPGREGPPQEFVEGPGYVGLLSAYGNGSLLVKSARSGNSGDYVVTVTPCSGQAASATVKAAANGARASSSPVSRSAIARGVFLQLMVALLLLPLVS